MRFVSVSIREVSGKIETDYTGITIITERERILEVSSLQVAEETIELIKIST